MTPAPHRPWVLVTTLATALVATAGCAPAVDDATDAGPSPSAGALVRVVKAGDGRGTVVSAPEGIDCDTGCDQQEHAFSVDVTSASLIATPARDALFERWSCAPARAGSPLETFVVASPEVEAFVDAAPRGLEVTCTASFRQLWTLQVVFSGSGTGKVEGAATAPGGGARIDCPDKCVAGYFHGEVDTLTAVPAPGSVFGGWKLDCAGTGPATVTLDDDKNCEAHFCPEASPSCP